MSDLEQQASTWVPPWQRHAPEPAPVPLLGNDVDELDDVDEGEAAEVAARLSGGEAPSDVDGVDDADDVGAEKDVRAAGEGAEKDVRAKSDGAAGDGAAGEGADGEGAEDGEAGAIPDLAAAAGAMLAQSLAEIDAAAADAKAAKRAEEKAARAERQKKSAKKAEAKPEPEAEEAPEVPVEPGIAVPEGELVPVLEAILMVVDEPVSEITLSQVLETPAEEIAGVLIELSARYSAEGRGFDLRRAAGGWRFYTRADYSSYVERFVLDGQQLRLTQASLETLAVVAYKQPVTRSRVSAIRGVNCDGVIRTLVTRGMIEECGTEPESGAHLYRTTTLFLEKMGLDSVEQLPPLAPFLPDNIEELAAGND